MTVLRDVDVILDTHASNLPVFLQDLRINVLARAGVLQHRVDDEATEVDLGKSQKISITRQQIQVSIRTPGSTVTTEPAGRLPRTRR